MNKLELTEEHKSKILEMCTVLFPEDHFSFENDLGDEGYLDRNLHINNPYEYGSEEYSKIQKKSLNWNDEGSNFHWFEFCFMQIMPKLYDDIESLGFNDNTALELGCIRLHHHHPVDDIYKYFKLKQEYNN